MASESSAGTSKTSLDSTGAGAAKHASEEKPLLSKQDAGDLPPLLYEDPGLCQLVESDQVFVKQIAPFKPGSNEYTVLNEDGEIIFQMKEDMSSLSTDFIGIGPGFYMDVYDVESERQVLSFHCPYSVSLSKMEVRLYGSLCSVVVQERTYLTPLLTIRDALGHPSLRIKGNPCLFGLGDFELQTLKKKIGSINKEWNGMKRTTNEDYYSVTYPKQLNEDFKATAIGASILIDYLYYVAI